MTDENSNYYVFQRACKNWREFAEAEKKTIAENLTYSQAREMCVEFNRDRSDTQIERGDMWEFTSEE